MKLLNVGASNYLRNLTDLCNHVNNISRAYKFKIMSYKNAKSHGNCMSHLMTGLVEIFISTANFDILHVKYLCYYECPHV